MDVQGRWIPASIPEDGELLQEQTNGTWYRQTTEDADIPLSKSQRRRSDVKVYKEFCDFYARL